jgi:hypothetical protein
MNLLILFSLYSVSKYIFRIISSQGDQLIVLITIINGFNCVSCVDSVNSGCNDPYDETTSGNIPVPYNNYFAVMFG